MNAHIERMNHENDPRVRAGKEGDWFKSFNETAMTATIVYLDDEGDDVEVDVPVKFGVCPTCDGKGSHVNPSIDAGGLSQHVSLRHTGPAVNNLVVGRLGLCRAREDQEATSCDAYQESHVTSLFLLRRCITHKSAATRFIE